MTTTTLRAIELASAHWNGPTGFDSAEYAAALQCLPTGIRSVGVPTADVAEVTHVASLLLPAVIAADVSPLQAATTAVRRAVDRAARDAAPAEEVCEPAAMIDLPHGFCPDPAAAFTTSPREVIGTALAAVRETDGWTDHHTAALEVLAADLAAQRNGTRGPVPARQALCDRLGWKPTTGGKGNLAKAGRVLAEVAAVVRDTVADHLRHHAAVLTVPGPVTATNRAAETYTLSQHGMTYALPYAVPASGVWSDRDLAALQAVTAAWADDVPRRMGTADRGHALRAADRVPARGQGAVVRQNLAAATYGPEGETYIRKVRTVAGGTGTAREVTTACVVAAVAEQTTRPAPMVPGVVPGTGYGQSGAQQGNGPAVQKPSPRGKGGKGGSTGPTVPAILSR